jgi:hypothetical protein
VRDLEQFLAQLPRDAEGMVGPPPPLAGGPSQLPASLLVDGSLLRSSSSSSPPPPDSTTAFPPPVSPPPQQPPASLAVGVNQLSSLQPSDICILMHAAGPDFEAKGYGKAILRENVKGDFILKANEVELSTLFGQMGVKAVDMPTLREAVASWKANPTQAFVQLETSRRAADAERQKQAEEEERKAAAAKALDPKVLLPATALPRPNFIRFAGCRRLSHPRQTRHHRSSGKRRLVSCSGPLDRRPLLRWPPIWRVSAVYIARRADDVLTRVFHEPKLCLLIHSFFSRNTPLIYSAWKGHTDVCRLLLENAADVNARDIA